MDIIALARALAIVLVLLFGVGLVFAAMTHNIRGYLRWCRRLLADLFRYFFRQRLEFTIGFAVGMVLMYLIKVSLS